MVFLDESGLLLAPLVRRTWAPRGQTPVLYQRGRSRETVSVIAALTLAPQRRRVCLYWWLAPNVNVTGPTLERFLQALGRHQRRRLVLLWDRLPAHRGRVLHAYLAQQARLRVVPLPPYAPERNPVEQVWNYLKRNPLANLAPPDAEVLADLAARHVRRLGRRPALLRAFLQATPLFSSP